MPRTELLKIVPVKEPSGLRRAWHALRSFTIGPHSLKDPELARMLNTGVTASSGVAVNASTAMASSAVWSAVTMIADDIASLPLMLYKRLPDGGKDRFEEHPLYRLLHDEPNPEMDSMVWRRTMQAHLLLWQNAYAEIERDKGGRPVALWPLVPERVTLVRNRARRLVYVVRNEDGGDAQVDPADMIHLVGYSHDGTIGSDLVSRAREAIGLSLAAERFGGSFFGNGSTFGGVVSFPGAKPPEMSEQGYLDKLAARHQGVDRAFRLMALYNGGTFEAAGVSPNEGQFTETRLFQIREIARFFKMPPHKLGDLADATYSNVEQMDAAYLSSCIRPWLTLWNQQLSRKLIARPERFIQFIEHETHGFLSVDAQARAALYSAEFSVGAITPNEMRGYENRDPIKGGDRTWVPLNMIPMDRVDDWIDAQIKDKTRPTPAQVPPSGPDDRSIEKFAAEISALSAALTLAQEAKRQAELQAEDLSEANAIAEQKRDEAEAALSQALEICTGAERALEAEQAEHARTRASLAEANDAAGVAAGAWAAEVSMAQQARQEAEAHLVRERADWAVGAERSAATIAELVSERDAIKFSAADAAERAAQEHAQALEMAQAGRAEVERALMKATEEANLNAHAAAAEAERVKELEAERDALEAAVVAEREAHAAELAHVRTERAEADSAKLQAEADKVAAEMRVEAAERDKAIAEQAQHGANTALDAIRQRESKRMLDVIAAHRALMVQAMRRILAKETDRARRHQATPQKLRAWMDTYYQSEITDIAEALLPIVRAHLAWTQSDKDPATVAEAMAQAHVEASQQQLRSVMAVEDWNQALAQALTRWEDKRPDAVADAFIREGLAYVQSL